MMHFGSQEQMTNPLIRRVRRHSELTTLFRPAHLTSAMASARSFAQQQTAANAWVMGQFIADGAASAQIPAVEDTVAFPTLPNTTQHVGTRHSPVPTDTGIQRAVIAGAARASQRAQPAALPESSSVSAAVNRYEEQSVTQEEMAPEIALPVSARAEQRPSSVNVADEDRNWTRLQQIKRAHANKELGDQQGREQASPVSHHGKPTAAVAQHASAELQTPPVQSSLEPGKQPISPLLDAEQQRAAGADGSLFSHNVADRQGYPEAATHPEQSRQAANSVQTFSVEPLQQATTSRDVERLSQPVMGMRPADNEAARGNSVGDDRTTQRQATDVFMAPTSVEPPLQSSNTDLHTMEIPSDVDERAEERSVAHQSFDVSASDSDSAVLQDLPLEAVWPVQRVAQRQVTESMPLDSTSFPAMNAAALDTSTTQAPTQTTTDERNGEEAATVVDAQLVSMLQKVQTAQPTESHVHVVTPRRPRPVVQRSSKKGAAVDEKKKLSAAKQIDDSLLQRSVAQADPAVEETPKVSAQATQAPHYQSPSDRLSSTGRTATPAVKTEIGDLPADLWRLIDEPLPENPTEAVQPPGANRRVQQAATEQIDGNSGTTPQAPMVITQTTAPATALAQRTWEADPVEPAVNYPAGDRVIASTGEAVFLADAPVSHDGPTQRKEMPERKLETGKSVSQVAVSAPTTAPTAHVSPSVLQRQAAATAEVTTADSASKTDEESPVPGQATADKIDTDELARQVYARLRRHLAVERERLR